MRAFHKNPDRLYTELTVFNTKSAYHKKSRVLLSSAEIFEASSTNRVDPDQTAHVGSTLFASILMLTNKQTRLFCWHFKGSIIRFVSFTVFTGVYGAR